MKYAEYVSKSYIWGQNVEWFWTLGDIISQLQHMT